MNKDKHQRKNQSTNKLHIHKPRLLLWVESHAWKTTGTTRYHESEKHTHGNTTRLAEWGSEEITD